MPLSLTVPAIENKPDIPAETRPKRIQALIDSLPVGKPQDSANHILEELGHLNRQRVSVDARVRALEIYRKAVLDLAQSLAPQYCNQPLPLSDQASAVVRTTQMLFIELAYGYKQALLAEDRKLFSLGRSKQLALLIQRTLHALSQLQLVAYHAYMTPSSGIWAEMHQLYLYALQQALQDILIEDSGTTTSITLTYKRALLLALADTHHLASGDIDRVVDYLQRFAHLARLQPWGSPESPAGVFMVSLKSDKPPVSLIKTSAEADMRTDILLITVDLARQVHQHLTQLQTNEPPKNIGLPETALDHRYQDMLSHLLKQWGSPPKRLFSRTEKNGVVSMCVGLPAVHYFLNGEVASPLAPIEASTETEITLNFTDDTPAEKPGAFESARWMIVNESAGGMALSKFPNVDVTLRVGELLGIKADDAKQWSIAVLRWAASSEQTPLGIGAQMLAPTAQAVLVRPIDKSNFERALLLPEIPALKQPATLITARGTYRPARELQVEDKGEKRSVLATRLVERTNSFERFQFSAL